MVELVHSAEEVGAFVGSARCRPGAEGQPPYMAANIFERVEVLGTNLAGHQLLRSASSYNGRECPLCTPMSGEEDG
jgi:hypothetical protein